LAGEELYERMAADYEAMVDWDKRLANELPFFRQLFDERSVRRVADVACGVGRHAIAFAKWGLGVVGVDPSEELLRIARGRATEEGTGVEFVRSDFLHLADALAPPFDAIVCIGNSLPHLLQERQVRCALEQMSVLLRPQGVLAVQTRSAERTWARGDHLLPPRLTTRGSSKLVFLRMVEVHPPTTTLHVIRLDKEDDRWGIDVKSTELRPIGLDEMERLLGETGFGRAEAYGDYQRDEFDPLVSEDLLIVATRTDEGGGA